MDAFEEVDDDKPVRCLKFRQQELWALKPVWSPRCVISMYYLVAAVFLPLGVAIFVQSTQMSNTDHVRYDVGNCDIGEFGINPGLPCVFPIVVEKDTPAPSYLYYGLRNFFQNARNYHDSRSAEQLRGDANPDKSECSGGPGFDDVVPCGLTANSRFNDTFKLCVDPQCQTEVNITKEGIAWDVDREKRFRPGKLSDGYTEESNALVQDEDFMVWMRLATYNNFHKLYRIIEDPLPAGTYYINMTAAYPVRSFGGEKFVFISETKWFGGRSRFLGIAYIVVGGLALLLATLFLVRAGTAPKADLPPETTVPPDGYRVQDSSSGMLAENPPENLPPVRDNFFGTAARLEGLSR